MGSRSCRNVVRSAGSNVSCWAVDYDKVGSGLMDIEERKLAAGTCPHLAVPSIASHEVGRISRVTRLRIQTVRYGFAASRAAVSLGRLRLRPAAWYEACPMETPLWTYRRSIGEDTRRFARRLP